MSDYINARIESVSVHWTGNKSRDEELLLSQSPLDLTDTETKDLLREYFLTAFTEPEFHAFTSSNEDFALNPMFNFVAHIFDHPQSLHQHSADIAKHLYDASVHPQIKSGDLFVAYISNIRVEDELTDAIGIFKSENKQAFLHLDHDGREYAIRHDEGINIEKLDKGCLIFDLDRNSGFKVCIVDASSKSQEAQYWKDNFLCVKPRSNDYYFTKEYMNLTKNFVTEQVATDFEVNRADQIDLLNRSVNYFKSRETFDAIDFEEEVLQDESLISSFRNYNESYRQNHGLEPADGFDISQQAVKKQSRVFKSVLKLDKNFHIYIHGDRNLIEQGTDSDGRKFYKIYFQNEA